jgi:hypothetical protein
VSDPDSVMRSDLNTGRFRRFSVLREMNPAGAKNVEMFEVDETAPRAQRVPFRHIADL